MERFSSRFFLILVSFSCPGSITVPPAFLRERDVPATEIFSMMAEYEIAERTVRVVKKRLGIQTYRKDQQWYWSLKKPGEVTGNAP